MTGKMNRSLGIDFSGEAVWMIPLQCY